MTLQRRTFICATVVFAIALLGLAGWGVTELTRDTVDAQVVAQWRAKLAAQRDEVVAIEKRHRDQQAAVGRQLAEMRARLLRMEAIGAHMADSASLDAEEFDFRNPPAQGGPLQDAQERWESSELASALSSLSNQIRQRERELSILDSVLVHEVVRDTSVITGRPVRWGWLSSKYGKRVDPITGQAGWHAGVDFAGREGSDVIAVASGVVTFAGERYGYGKLVEISHANGLVTRYAHHKEVTVYTGQVVKKGDTLGKMGSSGRSTGPHVHFEVLKNGRTVDPAHYLKS
ncbi:MAG: M23 family metallopeptidase [Pseudomonadota bacterium]